MWDLSSPIRNWSCDPCIGRQILYHCTTRVSPMCCLHTCMLSRFSHVQLFASLGSIVRQALVSMEFPREEYWSGLPYPPPGDLPNSGIEPSSLSCSSCSRQILCCWAKRKPHVLLREYQKWWKFFREAAFPDLPRKWKIIIQLIFVSFKKLHGKYECYRLAIVTFHIFHRQRVVCFW